MKVSFSSTFPPKPLSITVSHILDFSNFIQTRADVTHIFPYQNPFSYNQGESACSRGPRAL
ncbi:unnamed protein product [Tuber aestivum]|uniref:Uncharacterized protein n=1 Tax=Tuber aestivum TaxID=59557 RepID=A0A292Q5X7_9PEZI|nr:unnamed protein product [Tuber aestivum]